jgi:cell division protein FtsQ
MTTTTPTPPPTETPVPPPSMDPRIRERRIEVKRAMGRRRLRALIVVGSVIIAAGVAFLTINSPFLDVDRVQVLGTRNLTPGQVRAAARVHNHDALFFLDTRAAARRVEQLPWVEHASVQREFPSTVRIVVTEYPPVAFVRDGGDAVLLAPNGRAIARVRVPPAGAAEIRGVRRAPAVGELLSPPEAANVVAQLPRALAQQVEAVDVGGSGIALDLAGRGAIRLGSADDLEAKSAAALAVLAHNGNAPFSYIDVSTPATPMLRD